MKSERALNLDALRGFAILSMVLAGTIPYTGLPAWMYHAQLPPPDRTFNPNLPGLTWVDLVFPLFLFCLGAAIPLALNRRLNEQPLSKVLIHILERTALLAFFAIFLFHVRPHIIDPQLPTRAWLLALFGFTLMFLLFVKWPQYWSLKLRILLKFLAWAAAIILLYKIRFADGSGFSLYRSDIIIIVLCNVYFSGSLIWLFTRNRLLLRLGILAILLGIRLAHAEPGWVQWWWNFSPFPWLYKLYYHQYLFVVIPGTIIGETLLNWRKQLKQFNVHFNHPSWKSILIALNFILVVFVNLIGLQSRLLIFNLIATMLLLVSGWLLVRNAETPTEQFLRQLFLWACYWIILGLILEPYEGGIKKDHPTVSYYFVTTAHSIFLLAAFTIFEILFKRPFWLKFLAGNGQNPMIAYVGFANFLWPILALSGTAYFLDQWTASSPWLGFVKGCFYTLIVASGVYWLSKNKVFWKT